jgi:hypothetical protein
MEISFSSKAKLLKNKNLFANIEKFVFALLLTSFFWQVGQHFLDQHPSD